MKLEYRTIRNAKCLIVTAQANFGYTIEGCEDIPAIIEMTGSNKWAKLLATLIGAAAVKYIVATRCTMGTEKTYDDKSYTTIKFEFIKMLVKKYMQVCYEETVKINCENSNLSDDLVKRVVRYSSDKRSRSTFEIQRCNLIWNEDKYQEVMSGCLKRKSHVLSVTE